MINQQAISLKWLASTIKVMPAKFVRKVGYLLTMKKFSEIKPAVCML